MKQRMMINIRKLAAIDVAFLGPKVILTEFTLAVLGSLALGIFILFRSHSIWQMGLGWYLASLGINYVPLLLYAIVIARHRSARDEIGGELEHSKRANFKYTFQSLALLVPLLVPGIALAQEWHKAKMARSGSSKA